MLTVVLSSLLRHVPRKDLRLVTTWLEELGDDGVRNGMHVLSRCYDPPDHLWLSDEDGARELVECAHEALRAPIRKERVTCNIGGCRRRGRYLTDAFTLCSGHVAIFDHLEARYA